MFETQTSMIETRIFTKVLYLFKNSWFKCFTFFWTFFFKEKVCLSKCWCPNGHFRCQRRCTSSGVWFNFLLNCSIFFILPWIAFIFGQML